MRQTIELGTPFDLQAIHGAHVHGQIKLVFTDEARERVQANRDALVAALHRANASLPEDREMHRMYGINVGFGDNRVGPLLTTIEHQSALQENLILSHACGVGDPMPESVVRLAILIRANSLAFGHSGVRPEVIDALIALYEEESLPPIPCFGSVGASGDLAPLSHLALALFHGSPTRAPLTYDPRSEGFDSDQTFHLGPKEGLALNNGTSFMLADLILAHQLATDLCEFNLDAAAIEYEALCGVTDCMEDDLIALRPHDAITWCASKLHACLTGSEWVVSQSSPIHSMVLATRGNDTVQDDYCLRCTPVGVGTALKALSFVLEVIEVELASVTDNPIVLTDADGGVRIVSGNHFHGQPLASAADMLKVAITDLAALSERRLAKLVDHKRNYGLPNHLIEDNLGGLKSGWMIAQYTCASIIADLKSRSHPQSVDKVPTGNGSEDYVSMGGRACRRAHEMAIDAMRIQAVEVAAAVQAWWLRYRQFSLAGEPPIGSAFVADIREQYELLLAEAGLHLPIREDEPMGNALEAFANRLSNLDSFEFVDEEIS